MLLNTEDISAIFQETYPQLCRFLESIVGRDNHAQDIAQESFMRLCRAEFGNIPTAEIRFWLFRVARNLALNEVNKTKTRAKLWSKILSLFESSELHPEERLEQSENQRIVRELLSQLPEHQRSALLLREQEDMSYREIALTLNISESKVRVDIFRARQGLRSLWHRRQTK